VTYLWARRNETIRVSFLGLFSINAPYLPWTLIGFNLILNSTIPWGDVLGFIVGHLYYYLEDVYPRLPSSNSYRPLKTPSWIEAMVSSNQTAHVPPIEEII
jgi:Derlin-2/3